MGGHMCSSALLHLQGKVALQVLLVRSGKLLCWQLAKFLLCTIWQRWDPIPLLIKRNIGTSQIRVGRILKEFFESTLSSKNPTGFSPPLLPQWSNKFLVNDSLNGVISSLSSNCKNPIAILVVQLQKSNNAKEDEKDCCGGLLRRLLKEKRGIVSCAGIQERAFTWMFCLQSVQYLWPTVSRHLVSCESWNLSWLGATHDHTARVAFALLL